MHVKGRTFGFFTCDLCLDVGAALPAPLQDRPVKPPSKSLDPIVSFDS